MSSASKGTKIAFAENCSELLFQGCTPEQIKWTGKDTISSFMSYLLSCPIVVTKQH